MSAGTHDIEVDGDTRRARLDSLLVAAVAARAYLRDGESARFDSGPPRGRAFLAMRAGGARLVNSRIAPGIEAEPDNNELVSASDIAPRTSIR